MRTFAGLIAGAATAAVLLAGVTASTAAAPSQHSGRVLALSQEKWP